jgi:pimeloyl-ACP methyl ester carboxylesterase
VPAAARAALARGERLQLLVGGRRVAAWSFGRGPVALLMHGWGGYAGQLEPFIGPLTAAGWRVVAFDAPGHGGSAGSSTGWRQATFFDFAAGMQALAAVAGPVRAVLAHSGGAIATGIALRQGLAVERLVLLAPMTRPAGHAARFGEALGLSAEVHARWQALAEARLGASWDAFDLTRLPAAAAPPALVLHDRGDREVAFDESAALAAAWPAASLEPLSGLGHRRLLRDPAVVARAVAFLGAPAA